MPQVGDAVVLRDFFGRDHDATVTAVDGDVCDLAVDGKPLRRIARSNDPRPFTWRPKETIP